MNAITFWSWAYGIANGQPRGIRGAWILEPLRFGIELARRFNSDPIVKVRVGNRALLLPWSHQLPRILESCPCYEREIGRLAAYLDRKDGELLMIDVGANIGDTVATLPQLNRAKFLCVEGSRRYFDLLRKSYESDPNVTFHFALLTDSAAQDRPLG